MTFQSKIGKSLKDITNLRGEDLVLALLLGYVLLVGIDIPYSVAQLFDTVVGKLVLFVLVIVLFMRSPVLGILGLIVVFDLIQYSERITGTEQERLYLPTDNHRGKVYTALNQFPITVEQEIVSKMVPYVRETPVDTSVFKPVVEEQHQASKI